MNGENQKWGFTLAEVACAIVVLATALAGGTAMFALANKTSALNTERTSAYALVQGKMEELRAESYVNLVNSSGTETLNSKAFNWTVTITEPVTDYLKMAVVNISWVNAFSGTSSENFSVYYFNYGYSRTTAATGGSDENIDENNFINNMGESQGSHSRTSGSGSGGGGSG